MDRVASNLPREESGGDRVTGALSFVVFGFVVLLLDYGVLPAVFPLYSIGLREAVVVDQGKVVELVGLWFARITIYALFCLVYYFIYNEIDRFKEYLLVAWRLFFTISPVCCIFLAGVYYCYKNLWYNAPFSSVLSMVFYLLIFPFVYSSLYGDASFSIVRNYPFYYRCLTANILPVAVYVCLSLYFALGMAADLATDLFRFMFNKAVYFVMYYDVFNMFFFWRAVSYLKNNQDLLDPE